jgi:hypothetical protein
MIHHTLRHHPLYKKSLAQKLLSILALLAQLALEFLEPLAALLYLECLAFQQRLVFLAALPVLLVPLLPHL